MGLIQAEFDNLNVAQSDYATFVEAIPFQIYAILAIIMIPLSAFMKKDFSQMKKAEAEAASREYSFEEDVQGGFEGADGDRQRKAFYGDRADRGGVCYAFYHAGSPGISVSEGGR